MSYRWITIDEALDEFHTTFKEIDALIENREIDVGPNKISDNREIIQVSYSQLEKLFHPKDVAKSKRQKLSDIGLGAAVGLAASEALNSLKSSLRPEASSQPEASTDRPAQVSDGAPRVEIIIRYQVTDPVILDDIDEILQIAGERSDEIEIVIDDD